MNWIGTSSIVVNLKLYCLLRLQRVLKSKMALIKIELSGSQG